MIPDLQSGDSGLDARTIINDLTDQVNPNALAVTSDALAPPDIPAATLYVEITTSGSAGAEFVNVLAFTDLISGANAQRAARRMNIILKTLTDPADTVSITGLGTNKALQNVGATPTSRAATLITDVLLNSPGNFVSLVWAGSEWVIDAYFLSTSNDWTSASTVSFSALQVTSAGPGNSVEMKGGANFGAGDGGDVTIAAGQAHGGGTDGNVFVLLPDENPGLGSGSGDLWNDLGHPVFDGETPTVSPVAVDDLPTPGDSAGEAGQRAMVNDALTPVFGAPVADGGSAVVPVYSDGVAWRVG